MADTEKVPDWELTSTKPEFNTPEYKLWYAVLLRAIDDYKLGVTRNREGRVVSKPHVNKLVDIDTYFDSREFKIICSFLSIKPERIKARLKRWEDSS